MDRTKLTFISLDEEDIFSIETWAMEPDVWRALLKKFYYEYLYHRHPSFVNDFHAVLFYFGHLVAELKDIMTFPYLPDGGEKFTCEVYLGKSWGVILFEGDKVIDEFMVGEDDGDS